jgi:dipeptidyl aminopeptidase/acylaminoacyl peptidase
LDGHPLPGKTGPSLLISPALPGDEGDYTVVATDAFGAITNDPPARLFVVPTNQFVKANATNELGLRLPYFYELPVSYDPARRYPLVCYFHGSPNDENSWPTYLKSYALFHTLSSFRGQATDPTIVVWPTRRAGDNSSWTDQYVRQVTNLLDHWS